MTHLRQAAEQALKALEVATTHLPKDRQEVLEAMKELRQALAEPTKPDLLNQSCCECGKSGGYALYCVDCWNKASKWVGLTSYEIVMLSMEFIGQFHPADFARAIEHKLREKNHWNG